VIAGRCEANLPHSVQAAEMVPSRFGGFDADYADPALPASIKQIAPSELDIGQESALSLYSGKRCGKPPAPEENRE